MALVCCVMYFKTKKLAIQCSPLSCSTLRCLAASRKCSRIRAAPSRKAEATPAPLQSALAQFRFAVFAYKFDGAKRSRMMSEVAGGALAWH